MKVGLYSVTYAGVWYRGKALRLSQFIARAKELGFDGVEIGLKRPHGSPLDLDEKACERIGKELDRQGIELAACASYNDFSSPIPEHREVELYFLKGQIRLTRSLGAKILRVFAAWPGITIRDGVGTYDMTRRYAETHYADATYLERWRFVREGLREAAQYAGEAGVILALQNHAPIIRTYEDMLAFVREVGSPHMKACLDCPLLRPRDGDADYVSRAVRDTGDLQVHSHFGGEFHRGKRGRAELDGETNYPAFVKALKEIGYKGYLCYEFCHPCLDAKHQPAGMERVDEQTRMACEYMRRVIAAA
jgi:sugar phosphate isomerase/epimerase